MQTCVQTCEETRLETRVDMCHMCRPLHACHHVNRVNAHGEKMCHLYWARMFKKAMTDEALLKKPEDASKLNQMMIGVPNKEFSIAGYPFPLTSSPCTSSTCPPVLYLQYLSSAACPPVLVLRYLPPRYLSSATCPPPLVLQYLSSATFPPPLVLRHLSSSTSPPDCADHCTKPRSGLQASWLRTTLVTYSY